MPRSSAFDCDDDSDGDSDGESEVGSEVGSGVESEVDSESTQHLRLVDSVVDVETEIDTDSEADGGMVSVIGSANTEANIRAFVQRLKQMLPSIDYVIVQPGRVPNDVHESNNEHFISLVTQLCHLSNRFEYLSFRTALPMDIHTNDVHELVKFYYHENVNTTSSSAWATLVARQSAMTLTYLRISSSNPLDITGLLLDSDGGYVSFPYMAELLLLLHPYEQDVSMSVTPGVALFPSLRHMTISGYYPFDDDAPFRGNANTLEQLEL
ncbi:hypothetical protein FBU31_007118, partial [Coemansia sp. 'formosensis']